MGERGRSGRMCPGLVAVAGGDDDERFHTGCDADRGCSDHDRKRSAQRRRRNGRHQRWSGPIGQWRFTPAPVEGLQENSTVGLLPRIAADGRRPWQVYARPVPPGATKGARVAILVAGLGVSALTTQTILGNYPRGDIGL